MNIIERQHIDIARWDQLVSRTEEASVFSFSWYLDATAENWSVLVNDDYSQGIALPYSIRLGVKTLYTPIFVRYIEWLGENLEFTIIQKAIKAQFSNIEVSIKQPLLGENFQLFEHQVIESNSERKIGSQAKRSLKKAEKNSLEIVQTTDYSGIDAIVKSELVGKFNGIDEVSIKALSNLFEAAQKENRISVYEIKEQGGIVCIEDKRSLLYLKGTVSQSCKEQGGMYACLDAAIKNAHSQRKLFDFGGSRIEGVKRFNHNLGGSDVKYYGYTFDKAPIWFKLARRIKNKWSKK